MFTVFDRIKQNCCLSTQTLLKLAPKVPDFRMLAPAFIFYSLPTFMNVPYSYTYVFFRQCLFCC